MFRGVKHKFIEKRPHIFNFRDSCLAVSLEKRIIDCSKARVHWRPAGTFTVERETI